MLYHLAVTFSDVIREQYVELVEARKSAYHRLGLLHIHMRFNSVFRTKVHCRYQNLMQTTFNIKFSQVNLPFF